MAVQLESAHLLSLLARLADDPAAHAGMGTTERDALVNLKNGLGAVKRDPVHAPEADGRVIYADPASPRGWREETR